jgi:tRNA 2-thiouridine synthesizing protein E
MSDIKKHLGGDECTDLEMQDRLANLQEWSEDIAQSLASQEGIELTAAHVSVLKFLRKYYVENGTPEHARTLTEALEKQFAQDGGLKYLYRLFPNGPVNEGCRIAGIPGPGDSVDRSFGSVQ